MEVLLYKLETPSTNSTIKLIKNDETYLIDGYDSGKTVREVFGGYGYEYSIKFHEKELNKLNGFLNFESELFIKQWIDKYIGDPKCFSKIKAELDKKGITYTYFSWTDSD